MAEKLFYEILPENIDILVTHGPAFGILENSEENQLNPKHHYGCDILRDFLQKREDCYVQICGHIHEQGEKLHLSEQRVAYNVATKAQLITLNN